MMIIPTSIIGGFGLIISIGNILDKNENILYYLPDFKFLEIYYNKNLFGPFVGISVFFVLFQIFRMKVKKNKHEEKEQPLVKE